MLRAYKAKRQVIQIGNISLEVAMLPDGSYRLNHTQATEVVDKNRDSMSRFRRSKYIRSILGNTCQDYTVPEEVFLEGANRPIIPVTIELACLFWQKCAAEGNPKARAIVVALLKHSLYELADEAFGVKRSQGKRCPLTDDVSDASVARLEAIYQNLSAPESSPQPSETSSERELRLKIRLAQVELDCEKLRHELVANSFPAEDINKLGIAPWQLIYQVQKSLGWSDAEATYQLLRQLGYGFDSNHWFSIHISGKLSVMSWASADSLSKAIEQFKRNQN